MNKYESVIITYSTIVEEDKERIINKVKELTDKELTVEDIGIKKLAYPLRGNIEEGCYLIFTFECEKDKIDELEKYYRIEDNILKFITVRMDED